MRFKWVYSPVLWITTVLCAIPSLAFFVVLIDYTGASPATTIRGYLVSGRNNGAWNGVGIDSSLDSLAREDGRSGTAQRKARATLARLARVKVPEGRDGDIQLSLALARELATPAYPFDEAVAREWIEREVDAGPRDTKAQSRQVGAPWHGPKLREMRTPVLVLHGDRDPILRVSAARDTAKAIPGARLVILPGVGHDLPAPLWPTIAREVRQLADRARRPA